MPAAIALVIILVAGLYAERQSSELARMNERRLYWSDLQAMALRLQGEVLARVADADRLAGALAAAPPADAAGLAALAARLGPFDDPATRLAAVPATGTPLLYPPPAALDPGLAAALASVPAAPAGARIVATGEGERLLVWTRVPGDPAGGAAAVVAPAAPALAAAGLAGEAGTGFDLVLTGDGGQAAAPYLGDAGVLDSDPVRFRVALPGADWELAAVPDDGWSSHEGARWPIRLLTLLAAGLIVGPMMHTRRLTEERQRNILDLRDRETQLTALSRRLGLALAASRVGVWDYDLGADVLIWDDRMDELYGYPPTGRRHGYSDWRTRLHPDDLARAEAEFREAIERTGRYRSDYRLRLPDGEIRHIRAIGALYREADGSAKIVGVNWDVTADVALNEELNARRIEAEGASIAKSQFLATMSHEIRTPMNGVIGMLDLILRSELEPVQRERAEIARGSADQLLAILNDILDLSKLEANRITLDRTPVDVGRLAQDVVTLMGAGAGAGIEVRATVAPEVPARLSCDATRLRQVLMNLVGNAVKFTEAGCVEACVGFDPAGGGRLEVAVRDTGVGIPEEAKRDLFQRFAQVDSSVTRARGGTGLGLAISRELVELMGGAISVESVLGLGSTFRFWVPAPEVAAPSEPPAAPPRPATIKRERPALAVTAPARVLVAEDNPTNRQILSAYLAVAGHSAHMVTNGHEALSALEGGAFDLVIMDVQMPVMDGMTAAGRIRALDSAAAAIPIIALTANAMEGDRERCLAAGMTDYVAKPVSLESLYAAIARSLGA